MSGPPPAYRPCFPADFVEQAQQIVRRRSVRFQLRQRATLVLLLHEYPTLSNVEAGRQVQLHPDSVRDWRRRWHQGSFTLEDQPGRGRKPSFSPLGGGGPQSPRLRNGRPDPVAAQSPIPE